MHEEIIGSEPFLCLEVNSLSGLNDLAKKFDIIFPNRIIRLMHEGKYTPYFYLGYNKWLYKAADHSNMNFSCRVMLDENIFDFLSDDQIVFLNYLDIPFDELKIVRHTILEI